MKTKSGKKIVSLVVMLLLFTMAGVVALANGDKNFSIYKGLEGIGPSELAKDFSYKFSIKDLSGTEVATTSVAPKATVELENRLPLGIYTIEEDTSNVNLDGYNWKHNMRVASVITISGNFVGNNASGADDLSSSCTVTMPDAKKMTIWRTSDFEDSYNLYVNGEKVSGDMVTLDEGDNTIKIEKISNNTPDGDSTDAVLYEPPAEDASNPESEAAPEPVAPETVFDTEDNEKIEEDDSAQASEESPVPLAGLPELNGFKAPENAIFCLYRVDEDEFFIANINNSGVYSTAHAECINTYEKIPSGLTIKKTVDTDDPEYTPKEFSFKVTLWNKEDKELENEILYTDPQGNKQNFKSGGTITLKHGESVFLELGVGTKYKVEETTTLGEGWKTPTIKGDEGTITEETTNLTAECTNTYRKPQIPTTTYTPKVKKTVTQYGETITDNTTFTFELTAKEDYGDVVSISSSTGTVSGIGEAQPIGTITFKETENEPETYTFTITEKPGEGNNGYTYNPDGVKWELTVTVEKDPENEGKLKATGEYKKIGEDEPSENEFAEFTNVLSECKFTPEVEKILLDKDDKEQSSFGGSKFTFRMEPANVKLPSEMFYVEDKPNETGRDIDLEYTVDEPGRQSFDKAIIFPKDTIEGDYIFWLWETDENRVDGIRYDDTVYELTVKVEKESGGKLTAELASWQAGRLTENRQKFEATGDLYKPDTLFAEENRVKFTNQYTDDVPCTYTPQVEKILLAPDGETELNDSTEEFSFTLTYDGDSEKVTLGETTATASAAKPGKFGAITFEEDGTYEFTIREEKKAGYLCDETEIKLTFTVKDLKVTKAEYTGAKKDAAVFTNTQTEEETGSLIIKKVVSGGPESARDKTFTFTVTGPDNYSETVTLTAGETKTLSGLPLGTYTVTESGAELGGYTLTVDGTGPVEVTAGETAEVTVTNTYKPEEPEEPEEPTEPETPDEPERPQLPDPNDPDSPETVTITEDDVPTTYVKVWDPETEEFMYIPEDEVPLFGFETPETGDNSQTVLLGGVCALALAGIVALAVTKRRNKKEQ